MELFYYNFPLLLFVVVEQYGVFVDSGVEHRAEDHDDDIIYNNNIIRCR